MQIDIRPGYAPFLADKLPDARVFIDIFRASTTSLAIIEGQAQEALICNDFEELKKFSAAGALIVSEVLDLGIDNSPTLLKSMDLKKKTIVLKTGNLTTAIDKNAFLGPMYICSFNNLSATIKALKKAKYASIEIIPAGIMAKGIMTLEDEICAKALKMALENDQAPIVDKAQLKAHAEFKCQEKKRSSHFIADMELAIQLDISSTVIQMIKQSPPLYWLGKSEV